MTKYIPIFLTEKQARIVRESITSEYHTAQDGRYQRRCSEIMTKLNRGLSHKSRLTLRSMTKVAKLLKEARA